MSLLWIRRLISSRFPLRIGSDPRSVHVGFVVNKVALGKATLRVSRLPLRSNDVVRSTIRSPTLKMNLCVNPLTPELNPSAQRCLTRFFIPRILLLEPSISLIYA
jgi:hypothetical protein